MAKCLLSNEEIPDSSNDLLYVVKPFLRYCGYKEDYLIVNLTELERSYVICPIYEGIIREAVLDSSNITCKGCSKSTNPNSLVKIRDSISKLQIRCPLLRGCEWKGSLSEAEMHLHECQYFLELCLECNQVNERGDVAMHETYYCSMRNISCEYCQRTGLARDLATHLDECPNFLVDCPNECGEVMEREIIEEHNEECPKFRLFCHFIRNSYSECSDSYIKREELPEHNKDQHIMHINMLREQVELLGMRLDEMELKLKCKKDLDGCEVHLYKPFYSQSDLDIIGPDFYVQGYKLQVFACVDCIERIISFKITRIPGDYDGKLCNRSTITECRILSINKNKPNNSDVTVFSLDYNLKIGVQSECFGETYVETSDEDLIFRLYFDINTSPIEDIPTFYAKDETVSTTF
ncbi:TNF receptor-associated factor 4-like [Oopsacas minuta]|uniref:TNF receptor-associated factor 4-like n=1 Tax=Oopsacas minuta TaxID=111878 RepID=A0AAV7JYR9_9METZ|nr:TNF receptor-associated factor 4-like [Oopsacas minuta]